MEETRVLLLDVIPYLSDYFLGALFFFKIFIYLFLERGEGREKEVEKHQCVLASHVPPTGYLVHNPGMCPDWEWNHQRFGLQAGT